MSPFHIMLVDDEESILKSLERLLRATPCTYNGEVFPLRLETFTSAKAALERMRHTPFDLFLSDYRMPEMTGVDFLKATLEIQPDAARLILSGYADLNSVISAINDAHIYRFLSKPWNDYELVSAIGQALGYRRLLVENKHLADRVRFEKGKITAEELERRRLEDLEPGITQVNWGEDGSVILDDLDES
ncbi:MAG: response regulator [Formivibrio sp.]|nr:response regulator [Formivibrio sp.]